jgi:hypothetical protein
MPFDEINRVIFTKTLGVVRDKVHRLVLTEMFEEQELTEKDNAQKVLKEMFLNIDAVKYIYLKFVNNNYDVHVLFNDQRDYRIGFVKRDYNGILNSNNFFVQAWKITGGHLIRKATMEYPPYYGHFGLNLTIKLRNATIRDTA